MKRDKKFLDLSSKIRAIITSGFWGTMARPAWRCPKYILVKGISVEISLQLITVGRSLEKKTPS